MTSEARRAVRQWLLTAVVGGAVLTALPARAVLGGDATSIETDRVRLAGSTRSTALHAGQLRAHDIRMSDGSSIRQYVGPDGVVFAVAWSTRLKPDLAALLGSHATEYAAAASEALKAPGMKRAIVLQRADLVIRSSSHLNNFVGLAYLRSRVPAGVQPDELR